MANGPGWTRVESADRRSHTELRDVRRGVSYHLRPHAYKTKEDGTGEQARLCESATAALGHYYIDCQHLRSQERPTPRVQF